MTSPRVRIGVVGTGFGLRGHLPAFASLESCSVVAIAGRSAEAATSAAATVPGIQVYDDWKRMLDDADLDAVSVAVPPSAQPEIVCRAAERSIAVFCEKPIAASVADGERMLRAVTERGVAHAVDFQFPEIPAWRRMRSAVAVLSADGPLHCAAVTWRVNTFVYEHNRLGGWKRDAERGGGALNNFGSHCVFYLEWMFGPVRRVNARLSRPTNGSEIANDAEPGFEAWLEFASGNVVSLSVSLNCPSGSGHRLEVYGERGTAILSNPTTDHLRGFSLVTTGLTHFASPPPPHDGAQVVPEDPLEPTRRIARRFVDHVRSGGSPAPNLAHGCRVNVLLDAMRRSHGTRQWIETPDGLV